MAGALGTVASRPPVPILLAIVGATTINDNFAEWIAAAVAAGLPAVLVRDRERADRDRLVALESCVRGPLTTLASGRGDLCLASGAAGVHLPTAGVPLPELRRLIGPEYLIGQSTHSLAEVEAAARAGADYVVFGPVWDTPGKGPAVGLEGLRAATAIGVPVLALGGVSRERIGACIEAGAAGIAGIRCCAEPAELARLVDATRSALLRVG